MSQIPRHEIELTFTRSSGPGGQNVNKVNSKAVLRWNLDRTLVLNEAAKGRFRARFGNRITSDGDVVISGDSYRDQGRNAEDCIERLQAMIAEARTIPKKRRPSRPTRGSIKRRVEGKRKQSEKKQLRKRP